MTLQILTANDLHSGCVIFLTSQGDWSPFISSARISENDQTVGELELAGQTAVNRQMIVEPFFIDVMIENGIPSPVRFREQLRVSGPSVRSEFSKPFLKEAA